MDLLTSFLAEDSEWENVPGPSLRGRTAIRARLAQVFSKVERIEWVLMNAAVSADGSILTERLDRIHVNGQCIELRLMGIFRVSAGRIALWRDYFDHESYRQQKRRAGWTE